MDDAVFHPVTPDTALWIDLHPDPDFLRVLRNTACPVEGDDDVDDDDDPAGDDDPVDDDRDDPSGGDSR